MQGRADIQARRLKLKDVPDVELMQKTLGELNGDTRIFAGRAARSAWQ